MAWPETKKLTKEQADAEVERIQSISWYKEQTGVYVGALYLRFILSFIEGQYENEAEAKEVAAIVALANEVDFSKWKN